MNNINKVMGLAALLTLSGCASLGVGEPDFGCKGRPDGVRCISSSEAYEQSNHTDKLRSVNPETGEVIPGGLDEDGMQGTNVMPKQAIVSSDSLKVVPLPAKPYPVRTPSKVIRVWIAPWVDKKDNLHAGGYLFSEIEKRTWTLGELNANSNARLRPLKSINASGNKKPLAESGNE